MTRLRLAVVAVCVAGLAVGCSSDPTTPRQSPGGVDNPTISIAPTATTVTVHSDVAIPTSPAVRGLLTFVQAHAESVRAGGATAQLGAVVTPAQLGVQNRVIAFARDNGYVVPAEPVVRVVSVLSRSATQVALGACFWLPSTEYVVEKTGAPPGGPVPRAWAPAVATLDLAGVTWSVDNLKQPGRGTSIRCGGHP